MDGHPNFISEKNIMSTLKNINNLLDGIADDAIDSGLGGKFLEDYVQEQAMNLYKVPPYIVKPYIENIQQRQQEIFFESD